MQSSKGKSLSFINPFPLCAWACFPKRWEEAQVSKVQVKLKPSATFTNHARHQDLSIKEQFCQRSKTEQDLKNVILTPEGKDTLEESGVNGEENDKDIEVSADVHVLLYSSAHVKVRVNHYQYLMLLRMKEVLQAFQEQLTQDTQEVMGSRLDSITTCIGIMFNSAELAFLMHPTSDATFEPRSADSDSTSLIESELSPSESREGLATEEKDVRLDSSSEKGDGSPMRILEDHGIENPNTSVLRDRLLISQSDGSLGGEEFHSQAAGGKGPVEEAHEAEETLSAKKPGHLDSLSHTPHVLPSSPSSIVDPLGGIQVSLNGQEELIPLKNMEMELSSALHITKDATKEALNVTMDFTKEAMSMTKEAFSLSRERMASTMQKMLLPPQAK